MFNNILVSSGEVLACSHGTENVSADYNLCRPDLAHQGPHSTVADPRFFKPDFWGRPVPQGKAPDLGAFAFEPSLATEKARIGWFGWPYRFAPKGEMELPDLWAPPEGAK